MDIRKFLSLLLFSLIVFSCARMGQPDGGWFDEDPPHVVSATPADKAIGVKANKVMIFFDEFIKLDNPTEKVVISPPQLEQPEIKATGKRIIVELKDSLIDNTTYTIDFSDAISDNNENNPMGNFTYSFSTGDEIDTLEISGIVLSAQDLEPVKGVLVGLYRAEDFENAGDTAYHDPFKSKPLLRVSNTDSRGHFIIRGIAPGSYRVFALQDADQDFRYTQASEAVAFNHDIVVPSFKPDTRPDTIWQDSLHIKDIVRVPYTHFLPDNIVLRLFTKEQTDRYLLKAERSDERYFTLFFNGPAEELPVIKGMNFNSDDAFVMEYSAKKDTIRYWLRDTMLVNQDTLRFAMTHIATDTAGVLNTQTDTLEVLAKTPYEKRMKKLKEEMDDWYKDLAKRRKRAAEGEVITDTIFPQKSLAPKYDIGRDMSPVGSIKISLPTPAEKIDTSAIHLYMKKEDNWYNVKYKLRNQKSEWTIGRDLELIAEWEPDAEYSFEVDSMAFVDIYGLVSKAHKAGLRINGPENYGSLFINVSGVSLPPAIPADSLGNGAVTPRVIVQMLSKSGEISMESPAVDGLAEFYYVMPGEFYLRAFVDANGNGKWDTGDYDQDIQPEPMYYYPEKMECRAKWDITRDWNLTARPVELQKPGEITKQKGEKQKTIKQRNAQRAHDLGIKLPEYLQKYPHQ